jgi:dolichol kinase
MSYKLLFILNSIMTMSLENIETIDIDDIESSESLENNDNDSTILGNIYHRIEKYIFPSSVLIIILSCIILVITTLLRSNVEQGNEFRFWMNQLIKYISIGIFQIFAGYLVDKHNLKVNYSRKIVHLCYFLFPLILDKFLLKFEQDKYTSLWTLWTVLSLCLLSGEFFIKRSKILKLLYTAIDRPEDRPYTRLWFISQLFVSIIIIIIYSYIFANVLPNDEHNRSNWIFIIVLIVAIGDGMAEPIGIRFGKHKYTTTALCTNKKYERSIEGSLWVAFISIVSISIYYNDFTLNEYITTVIILPIIMTVIEAISPHTWDNPILFFTGYSTLVIIHLIIT